MDGALFAVPDETVVVAGEEDVEAPGAPRNNHLPLPGEIMEATEMEPVGFRFQFPRCDQLLIGSVVFISVVY